jgi:uncharacterized membrane protein
MTQPKGKTIIRPKRQTFFQRMRGNFLTGLVVVAPIVLTAYLIWTVVTFIDGQIVPWVPKVYNPSTYGLNIPGFGVVVFLLFTAIVGAITKGFVGRQVIRWGEDLVDRTPIVRSVYNALKQIVETILNQSQATFQKACLVEYPRRGIWAVAFVSTETGGELPEKMGEDEMMSVFLPTTPNPTSGFLLFVPKRDVVMLDMDVEQAAKLVISAGLVVPPTEAEKAAGVKKLAPVKKVTPARRVRQTG